MDDLQYHRYVRDKIERGIADAEAGRVVPHEDVIAEIRRRSAEYDAGLVDGIPWEVVKRNARRHVFGKHSENGIDQAEGLK
jgi:hypothetical protein